jgi:hypothetical protein
VPARRPRGGVRHAGASRLVAEVVTEPSNPSFLHAATATTTGDVTGTLRSTEDLQEALQLVVAAYRDIGPPPEDDKAVHVWSQEYGRIAYLAEQLPRRNLDAGLAGGRLHRSGTVRISSYFCTL